MGFCGRGEGGPFVAGGRIALGGALPVNPSGGQLAQAFMLSMNNLCESVRQLRGAAGPRPGKDAEVGPVAGYSRSDHPTLRVGLPVEVTFERIDERLTLPIFRCTT